MKIINSSKWYLIFLMLTASATTASPAMSPILSSPTRNGLNPTAVDILRRKREEEKKKNEKESIAEATCQKNEEVEEIRKFYSGDGADMKVLVLKDYRCP